MNLFSFPYNVLTLLQQLSLFVSAPPVWRGPCHLDRDRPTSPSALSDCRVIGKVLSRFSYHWPWILPKWKEASPYTKSTLKAKRGAPWVNCPTFTTTLLTTTLRALPMFTDESCQFIPRRPCRIKSTFNLIEIK